MTVEPSSLFSTSLSPRTNMRMRVKVTVRTKMRMRVKVTVRTKMRMTPKMKGSNVQLL